MACPKKFISFGKTPILCPAATLICHLTKVNARNHLGHGVLYLKPCVHFHKIIIARVNQKLNRAHAPIRPLWRRLGRLQTSFSGIRVQEWTGFLLLFFGCCWLNNRAPRHTILFIVVHINWTSMCFTGCKNFSNTPAPSEKAAWARPWHGERFFKVFFFFHKPYPFCRRRPSSFISTGKPAFLQSLALRFHRQRVTPSTIGMPAFSVCCGLRLLIAHLGYSFGARDL